MVWMNKIIAPALMKKRTKNAAVFDVFDATFV